MNKEEIKKEEVRKHYIFSTTHELDNENKMLKQYIEQLENKVKEQEELNNKYLQKLVYALSPTTHALGDDYNNAFKKIIADNIDLETCKIRRKLKEWWGIDKY